MKQPFFDVANMVLNMYDQRQQFESVPADTPLEVSWGSEMLLLLAGIAGYAGQRESIVLRAAAREWKRTGKRPADFVQRSGEIA